MKTKKPARKRENLIGVNYCRYSSHSQRDASIEQQMAAAQAYAAANGITIIETYADRAITGRTDDRHEFQRMLRDAERGKFECVIAWKSDRLGRNMLQAMQNEARLNAYGVICVYVEENFDDSAAGRFALRNMMNVNQFYSESMAENVTRGMRYNAENCMVTNGQLPFGYKVDSSLHYELDHPKDDIVREIFTRIANGEPIVDIYTDLNNRNILTGRGKPWTKSGFHRLLHNERYKGIYIYDDIRIENGIPRIVSDELFDKVQKVLKMKNNPSGRHRSVAEYLLTGKLFCGYCKSPMTGMSGRSKTGDIHYYYACSYKRANGAASCKKKTVRKDKIEFEIASTIKQRLNDPEVQEWLIDRLMERQERYHRIPELEILKSRQAEVNTSIKNLLTAIEAGIVTSSTKSRLEELEAENANLSENIRVLSELKNKHFTREQILNWFSSLQNGKIEDKQYQKQIFQLFLKKAYLYDDKITIVFDTAEFSGTDSDELEFDLDDIDELVEEARIGKSVRLTSTLAHQKEKPPARRFFFLYFYLFTLLSSLFSTVSGRLFQIKDKREK